LEEREQGAECPAQKDYIIAVTYRSCKGSFVCVQARENAVEEGGALLGALEIAVEFEEFWEKGEDECEGDLEVLVGISRLQIIVKAILNLVATKWL